MTFPTRLLIEGEELVLDTRPHWIALVGPIAVTILVIVGWSLAVGYGPDGTTGRITFWGATIIAVLILLWYPVRRIVDWATSNFAVTTDRIIHRQGFIAKHTMEIPLEAINDIRFHQSILERMVGAGDLVIQSASEFGRNVFANIPDPEGTQRTIYRESEANKDRMYKGAPSAPAEVPAAPSVTTELERLADLRAKGVLSEEEFQAQKRRVLGDG
jgi:uncharacterized membrane protein YdbT with pleckstrin-like domain